MTKRWLLNITLMSLVVYASQPVKGSCVDPYDSGTPRPVDVVICLDTSGSMSGLINSARARLWDMVNEFAKADPPVSLRVGLLTYGSPHNSSAGGGWVVYQTNLTHDLDNVYSKMMSMSTNGGEEYVGWVLNQAVHTMSWSCRPDALKMIFVAGNESADQASNRVNFRNVASVARSRNITIHSIYCGNKDQGLREAWDQVALCGGGEFSAIDMQAATVQVSTPLDKILIKLEAELNATYVPYGHQGRAGERRQREQDENAAQIGGESRASRVVAKASTLYRNEGWDLVDAYQQKDFKLEEVPTESLPEPMQKLTVDKRHEYVQQMHQTRDDIQRRIQEVSKERTEYLRRARTNDKDRAGLDDAMIQAIRKEAKRKGIKIKD